MKIFIGNCSTIIDCESLIATCKLVEGETMYGPTKIKEGEPMHEDYKEQYEMMERAGYLSNNTIRFTHYYPSKHFDKNISEEFGRFCGVKNFGSFISRVDPGYCAPWHKDIFNNYYKELSEKYNLERFVMFLSKPSPGAGFILENDAFYMEQQGNVYKFPNIHSWHAGFNAGLESKYILTLTGSRI